MALVVKEGLMTEGDISVKVNWTQELYDLLWDDQTDEPRTLYMLVKDPDGVLAYPPFVFRRKEGDERGLTIGGPGILWTLGSASIGPTIEDAEYLSGADMLSNGDLLLGDLYWRRPSEGSLWVVDFSGQASNPGGLVKDDVFEYDHDFQSARAGHEYQAVAHSVSAAGRVRIRIIFTGRFFPPNLLYNGDFDFGQNFGWTYTDNIAIVSENQRSGLYAMRIAPIPQPQLITGTDFSTGWTLGSTMSQAGGLLLIEETPKPQYIPHAGAGDFTVSPYVTYTNTDPTKAVGVSGYYRKVGPIGQLQVVLNESFESGLANWTQAAGAWSTSSATFITGANSATTGGVVGGAMKNLQVSVPLEWAVGETWRFQAYACSGTKGTSDEADGEFNVQVFLIDQAYPLYPSYLDLIALKGDDTNADQWKDGQQTYTVPPDKPYFLPMATAYGHTAGSWYLDSFMAIRTTGNNTGIYSADFPAIPNQRYTFSCLFVVSDPRIDGNMTLRLIFKGPGKPDVESTTSLSQTYGQWRSLHVEGTCPKGYDEMVAAIDGDDILGGSFYVDADYTLLEKADNNTDRATGTAIPIVPDQRYLLGATIHPLVFVEKGTVEIGVLLSGPAVDDEVVSVNHTFGDETQTAARITVEVRAASGYDTATPFVLVKDLSGGEGGDVVAVSNFTMTRSDNNSDSVTGDAITATPERTYKWTQRVWFQSVLERGNVRLGVRCQRAGAPPETFYSSPMDKGEAGDTWQTLTFDFTPPSGFDELIPLIVGTDVDGGMIYLEDGEIRDTDSGTVVYDGLTIDPVGTSPFVDATAPEGTESVRVAVVVENGTTALTLDAVSLVRTDQTPATGNAIVADLLAGMSILPGTVTCPETIPADWRLLNLTRRAALEHYATVVSTPTREFKVTATDPPTLDIAERYTLFVDHAPDHPTSPVILVDAHIKDLDVEEMNPPLTDVSERPSEIKLIGTDRQLVSGGTSLIAARAAVPVPVEYGYFNQPTERTQIVSSGTVDHEGYAAGLAADLAEAAANPPLAMTITLNEIDDATAATLGIDARPDYEVGDWIYPYKPTAGLQDPNNPAMVAGTEVFPIRERVLERERSLPPGWTVTMRRPDGTSFLLPGVIHDAARTTLTVGTLLPEWKVDPQGKREGEQFAEWYKSKPRG